MNFIHMFKHTSTQFKCYVCTVVFLCIFGCGLGDKTGFKCSKTELVKLTSQCEAVGGDLVEDWSQELSVCEEGFSDGGSCTLQANQCYATCTTPRLNMCGIDVGRTEISYLLHGSAFFASQQYEEGISVYDFLANTLITMLVRGITFTNLNEASFPFDRETGTYSMETGRSAINLKLSFAENWGDYNAGDPIPNNVFNPRSYIRNIDIDFGSFTNPRLNITYDEGPLFDLIDGEIEFDGNDISSLSAKVKVKANLIVFELESISRKNFVLLDLLLLPMFTTEYTWELFQRTPPTVVTSLDDAIKDGSFYIDWSDSQINQKFQFLGETYLESEDSFSEAVFTLAEDNIGGLVEGTYKSKHSAVFSALGLERNGELYTSGSISSRELNFTEFFCDENQETPWGKAEHNSELTGGILTMQDGAELIYGIDTIPK